MILDSKTRFSSRVENYLKFRPRYRTRLLEFLKNRNILNSGDVIADVGSGTGFLAQLFCQDKKVVYGIEPNAGMRNAAETLLVNYPNFYSIDGSAEATQLSGQSVNIISVGQAFHWFELDATRREFFRILKPQGYVLLISNNRRSGDPNSFEQAYKNLVRKYSIDYAQVHKTNRDPTSLARFYGHDQYEQVIFPNSQQFDYPALEGRLLSSSYIPLKGPNYRLMLAELAELYQNHQRAGAVTMLYGTRMYFGQMN